jgi:16S rRNA A1518/A1519 N6-dimethyltransferase RsmA/KsgA/DIM1 with predicted DNA glycosylase/AP lyase activity
MGRPKRHRLGQNFLVDRDVAERIVSVLSEEPARVLEIGPGR